MYDVNGGWPRKPPGGPSGLEAWVFVGLAFVLLLIILCCCGGL